MIEIRTILCPVDFSPISKRNLRMGVEMCQRIGARLVLQHNLDVRPPGFLSVAWMWSEDHEAAAESHAAAVPWKLEELCGEIPAGIDYEARVTRGPLEETVLFVARGLPADLVIMGTHGKSSAEHDSLTERLVIEAPCSVLTIGESYRPEDVFDAEPQPAPETMRFLVPVDFSPRSGGVLRFAFALAAAMPHQVDLLHVVRGGTGKVQQQREVSEARKRLEALVPSPVANRTSIHVMTGEVVAEVLKAAGRLNSLCVVMGAHRKGMLKRFLFGTSTLGILHGASCPVWFVPESLTTGATGRGG